MIIETAKLIGAIDKFLHQYLQHLNSHREVSPATVVALPTPKHLDIDYRRRPYQDVVLQVAYGMAVSADEVYRLLDENNPRVVRRFRDALERRLSAVETLLVREDTDIQTLHRLNSEIYLKPSR
jgi:hypothetical protein